MKCTALNTEMQVVSSGAIQVHSFNTVVTNTTDVAPRIYIFLLLLLQLHQYVAHFKKNNPR